MLKEIIKLDIDKLGDYELDLGELDTCFDAVLARQDYHINFAGYDQNIVFDTVSEEGLISSLDDLAISIRETVAEHELTGPQSLIFTFVGDEMDYPSQPLDHEFCLEIV
ncbi:MAG: hypothetical protein OXU45_08080 [Candidatus Melainabacteria bacterium]|nr:hypothetical protein [Candidatus Melainabacteria bacterium]